MTKKEHIAQAKELIDHVKILDLREPVSLQDIQAAQSRLDEAIVHLDRAAHGDG